MVLQIAAHAGAKTYVYYQELYAPPNARTLAIRTPT